MHQTTAAIHAIFLALALLASQSWGYFAAPLIEDTAVVQQSDIEQGEEGSSLVELSVPTAPEKGPQVRTTSPKTAKDSAKFTTFQTPIAPVWKLVTRYSLSLIASTSYSPRPPTESNGYPHSHGNRGPPLWSA
ncbi:MAG: hypothetical protein ACRBFS_06300 [Aureispira sp.]